MTTRVTGARLRGSWAVVLLVGLLAWGGALIAASITGDSVLIPLVPLIGSFIVPFSILVWALEYTGRTGSVLTPARLVMGFAAGGVLGLWPAALIEHWLIDLAPALYVVSVAATEEVIKLLIVVLIAVGLGTYRRRDGMILGAVVGLGFAAFESLGYAYATATTLLSVDGAAAAELLLSRALLAPLGHGLWTALVAGALFAAARNGRLRMTGNVWLWLGIAILLHIGWDASAGLAALLVSGILGRDLTWTEFRTGAVPGLMGAEHLLIGTVRFAFLALNATVALWLIARQWRKEPADVEAVPD
jgi:RsiW-degrading membrane proteinase PrsW (M82 family)